MPNNKVSIINRDDNCIDISCYSNKWSEWLGWQPDNGSKIKQNVTVPIWIKNNKKHSIKCLKGLIQTDGSIYKDRGYQMINFVTAIPQLAKDVQNMITNLGYKCHLYKIKNKTKYTIRISSNINNFINITSLYKT